jgi:hypothetical protein
MNPVQIEKPGIVKIGGMKKLIEQAASSSTLPLIRARERSSSLRFVIVTIDRIVA